MPETCKKITRESVEQLTLTLASYLAYGETQLSHQFRESTMLYSIMALLVAFWVVGLVMHIGGGLIHTLLVVELVLFVFNLITGRSTSV